MSGKRGFVGGSLALLLAACVSTGLAVAARPAAMPHGAPIYIGFDGALTGAYATIGSGNLTGARAAVNKLNHSGGLLGRPVVLDVSDDGSLPSQAVINTQNFASNSKYAGMIGTGFGSAAVSASQVASAGKIPYVSESAASAQVYPPHPYVYTTPPTSRLFSYHIGQYLKRAHLTKVVIYRDPSAAAAEFTKYAQEYQAKYGLDISQQVFGLTQTDFSADLTSIKNSGAQALVVMTATPAAAAIVKQAKQLGLPQRLILTVPNATPIFLDPACPDDNGALIDSTMGPVATKLPASNPSKAVATAVNQALGSAANQFSYDGYDGMMMLAQAIRTAKSTNRDAINAAFERMRFVGATGVYRFSKTNHFGMSVNSLVMSRISNCVLVPLPGQNLTGKAH